MAFGRPPGSNYIYLYNLEKMKGVPRTHVSANTHTHTHKERSTTGCGCFNKITKRMCESEIEERRKEDWWVNSKQELGAQIIKEKNERRTEDDGCRKHTHTHTQKHQLSLVLKNNKGSSECVRARKRNRKKGRLVGQ